MEFLACPDKEQLRAYILGKLDDELSTAIAVHIDDCELCETVAQQLDTEPDSLIEILRAPKETSPFFHETELQRALQSVAVNSVRQSAQRWLVAHMPEQFGRYRILSSIGTGSMGAVYLAWDNELERHVAVKVPHLSLTGGFRARERFLRESKLAARIDHPNVCRIFDVGELDGLCYITMSYIEGQTLDAFLSNHSMSVREAVQLVQTIAIAVQEIHRHKIIHRDLKPGNIIVCPDGNPVVTDFGLALPNDGFLGDSRLSIDGTLIGSPAYMPPEQAAGKPDLIGPTADVYSLGVILFELITGELPFQGTVAVVLAKVINDSPPVASSRRADVLPALDEICLKAMANDPAARFSSMSDFAAALDAFLTNDADPGSSASIPTKQKVSALKHDTVAQGNENSRKQNTLPRKAENKQRTTKVLRFVAAISIPIAISAILFVTVLSRSAQRDNGHGDPPKRYGLIRIVVDDPTVTVIIDGLPVKSKSLEQPLNLETGMHSISLKRHGIEVNWREFFVRAGKNRPLIIRSKWS